MDPSGAGQVYIDNAGKLGVFQSSQRFKRDVQPMNTASEAILALKPVTFHYKNDAKKTPCFGLIAEQVAQIDPTLVLRDKEGKPSSVRYDQVNAMLLNEFLKEHKAFLEEQQEMRNLKKEIVQLTATVKGQAAQIRKVTTQIELQKPAANEIAASQK